MAKSTRPIDDESDDDTPRRKKPMRRDDDSDDQPAPKLSDKKSAPLGNNPNSKSKTSKKKSPLKLILLLGGGLGFFLLLVCGGVGYWLINETVRPKGVVRGFQRELNSKDWDKVWDRLDQQSQANFHSEDMRNSYPGKTGKNLFLAYMNTPGGDLQDSIWMIDYFGDISSEKITGDTAEVTIKPSTSLRGNPRKNDTTVKLNKEGGQWKIHLMTEAERNENLKEKTGPNLLALMPVLKPKFTLNLPDNAQSSQLALSDDGKIFALQHDSAVPPNGTIIYDLSGDVPKEMGTLKTNLLGALSPNGSKLIDNDGKIFETNTLQQITPSWEGWHRWFHFTTDDQVYGIKGDAAFDIEIEKAHPLKVRGWSISKKAQNDSFELPDHRINNSILAKNRTELWLLMPQKGGGFDIHCHALPGGKFLRSVTLQPKTRNFEKLKKFDKATSFHASPDGKYVGVGDYAHIFDAETGAEVFDSKKTLVSTEIATLALGGTRVIGYVGRAPQAASPRNEIEWMIFDWGQSLILTGLECFQSKEGHSAYNSTISADTKRFAVANWEGNVIIFDLSPFK